jgi:hypothetical protein
MAPIRLNIKLFYARSQKLRKSTISSVISVCLSVLPTVYHFLHMEQLVFFWANYFEISYLSIILNSVEYNQFPLEYDTKG